MYGARWSRQGLIITPAVTCGYVQRSQPVYWSGLAINNRVYVYAFGRYLHFDLQLTHSNAAGWDLSVMCVSVRIQAGCVRRSVTWTCCRRRSTRRRSCARSGTGRGSAAIPAAAPGPNTDTCSQQTLDWDLRLYDTLIMFTCVDPPPDVKLTPGLRQLYLFFLLLSIFVLCCWEILKSQSTPILFTAFILAGSQNCYTETFIYEQ